MDWGLDWRGHSFQSYCAGVSSYPNASFHKLYLWPAVCPISQDVSSLKCDFLCRLALVPRRQRSEIAASSLGVTEEAEQNGPSLGGAVQMAEINVHRKFLVVPWGTLLEFPIPRGSKITKVLLSSNRDITIDKRQQLITPT